MSDTQDEDKIMGIKGMAQLPSEVKFCAMQASFQP